VNDYRLLSGSPCIGTGRYGRDRGALPYMSNVIRTDQPLPSNYVNLESYPNPFNSSTRIECAIANPALAVIDIFNFMGQRVCRLYKGDISSGLHSFTFTPNDNLSAGTYILRLSTDGRNIYRKISYIK
jgi:hypothetical protein